MDVNKDVIIFRDLKNFMENEYCDKTFSSAVLEMKGFYYANKISL